VTTPVVSVSDVKQLVRNVLIRESSITSLVGDRIRTAHIVDPDRTPTSPFLVIERPRLGRSGYEGGFQRIPLDVYVYSTESQAEADKIYDVVYQFLQAKRLVDTTTSGGVRVITAAGYIRQVGSPSDGWNEQIRAWFTIGRWISMTAG